MAERDRERRDRAIVMDEAVEPRPLLARLRDGVADHDEGARQNLQMVAVTADPFHPALHVGVESARRRDLPPAAKMTSAVSAASWRPASDAPACTITGQP